MKIFESKRTVHAAVAAIEELVDELCAKMRHHITTGETVEVYQSYLAWSTDSASQYIEHQSFGFLHNEKKAQEWKQVSQTMVEFMPFEKQFPAFKQLISRAWASITMLKLPR